MSKQLFAKISKSLYRETRKSGRALGAIIAGAVKKVDGDDALLFSVYHALLKEPQTRKHLPPKARQALKFAWLVAKSERDFPGYAQDPEVNPEDLKTVLTVAGIWAYADLVPALLMHYGKVLSAHTEEARSLLGMEEASTKEVRLALDRAFTSFISSEYASVPKGDWAYRLLSLFR